MARGGGGQRRLKALDTNILARLIVRDDPAQFAIAEHLVRAPFFVAPTVLLETGWLLLSRYGLAPAVVADALRSVIDLPEANVDQPERIFWALERMEAGADFADMMHLALSHRADAFATFDARIAGHAGADPPVAVETLRA